MALKKSAKELKAWMEDVIKDQTKDTVVVFAQDVLPDTIFEVIDANALIR
jgi:ferredoxin-fold anticodon binding domain-containing protein